EPESVCTETFLTVGTDLNLNRHSAKNISNNMHTKFFRFLHGMPKRSQDATAKSYVLIPMQDFTDNSDVDWNKSISEIDRELYKKYRIARKEMHDIENKTKLME